MHVDISAIFWLGSLWPYSSRMIKQYPRKDIEGHPGDLGLSRVIEWVGWGDTLQALKGSSKSFSRLYSGADRARCKHGAAGSQGAG